MKNRFRQRGQKLTSTLRQLSDEATDLSRRHVRQNLLARLSHVRSVRILVLEWLLLMAILLSLSIAQSFWYAESYANKVYVNGGGYTEATLGKINSLNPLFAITSSEKTLSKLLFATLAAPDYSGHIGQDLAESIKTDEKGRVWTVKLRDQIYWSDGNPITNADVIYTINLINHPRLNTPYSANFAGVKLEEQSGALVFTLPSAYSSFSSALNIPILPAHILRDVSPELISEHPFSQKPVTSGPFTFHAMQTVGKNGEKIAYLNSNSRYFRGAPLLSTFSVHAFPQIADIISAINSGAVTATADLAPSDTRSINRPGVYEKRTAISSGVFAFLNTKSEILRQKSLRQAIRQGLDLRSLRAPGGEERALDYPLIKERIAGLELPSLPTFDPSASKATIKNANLSNDRPLKIATARSGYLPALAENLEFQLKNLGFPVELNTYEPGQDFLSGIVRQRAYDILLYEIELGSDPDLFAYYHSSNSTGLNLSNYSNFLFDDLLLAARSTMNPETRATKLSSIIKIWVEDVPAIGIYQVDMSYFLNHHINSFSSDNRLTYPVDRFSDVNYWASEQLMKNRTP